MHKYTFINLCRENTAIELGDETAKIILCCEGNADDVSGNMKAFLKYIADGKPGDPFTDEIERAVTEAKEHKRWRQEYMTLLEQYEREREEGRAEGLAEGHAKGLEEGHAKGLEEGHAKGLEEGHAKGLEEGHAKGLEEGRTEERKNTERERRRADVAEAKIKELEKLLAEHR